MAIVRNPKVRVEITPEAIHFVEGKSYVEWLLERKDEVLVAVVDHGQVLFGRLPNGKIVATTNPMIIHSFMEVFDASYFSHYGRKR